MPKATTRSSRPDERVMVFIDGSNLYHVLGQTCGRHDLQFDKFAEKLANGRDLRRVYYYNIRQEAFEDRSNAADQDKFLSSLYDTPLLEVKLGIWKQRGSTMVEKGVDVMLAVDLVLHAAKDHYDSAIIVSGDADFYPALQAAKDMGKHVEVAAFETNISAEAARIADVHIKLNKTFFTGLWMTKAQLRQRGAASRRPEVTDEAASPNGEDKGASKSASRSTSRRGTRRSTSSRSGSSGQGSSSSSSSSRSGSSSSSSSAATESTNPVKDEPPAESPDRSNIRRTPSRRKVGGTLLNSSSNTNGHADRPKPPALRTPTGSSNGASSDGTASESESKSTEPASVDS